MKKIAMFLAAAAIAVSASAQNKTALVGTKAADNIYIGGALGIETAIQGESGFASFNPNATFIVGKYFNPVFGLRFEATARFNAHSSSCPEGQNYLGQPNTAVNAVDLNMLGTFNLMNLFGGYKGEPRKFEVIALYGFGWQHQFDHVKYNALTSKAGIDLAFNFGKAKQHQIFIEPAVTWQLAGWNPVAVGPGAYDGRYALMDLKLGYVYKFKCSNGKHNFSYEKLRDQSKIDSLNGVINGLRADLDKVNAAIAAANAQAANLKAQLEACQNTPKTVEEKDIANLQPSVVFAQGKSVVDKSQLANVDMIAKYMKSNPNAKVKISGYASPEGSKEINDKLSKNRANNVKNILVKKYKISADRIEAEGLGATDKLFKEVEFNRVALFNDTTK